VDEVVMPAMSDGSTSDEIARNRRLAERIANGTTAPDDLDQVIKSVREMAAADLDVPGPQAAAQIAD
jgi:hypothetical protein